MEIVRMVDELRKSYGNPRPLVEEGTLEELHKKDDINAFVAHIKRNFALNLKMKLGLVNSGGAQNAPMWIRHRGIPLLFDPRFTETEVILFIRKEFIIHHPFQALAFGIAHEMSHILLYATKPTFAENERFVDVTAMFFGFRHFYLNFAETKTRRLTLSGFQTTEKRLGYLDASERQLAYKLLSS